MEVTAYASSEKQRLPFSANKVVALVLMSNKHLREADIEAVMAVNRKYVIINKRPKTLKIVQRITGQHTDVSFDFEVTGVEFLSYQDSDTFVAISKSGAVGIVSVQDAADSTVVATTDATNVPEGILQLTPLSNHTVAVLGVSGSIYTLACENGKVVRVFEQSGKVTTKILSGHQERGIVAVPSVSSSAGVDIVSMDTIKSVLSKPWSPHGDDVPSMVHIFANKSTPDHHEPVILTANATGTEVRLWTLTASGAVTLCQHVAVTGETDADAGLERIVSVSPMGDYVLLAAKSSGSIVVLELDAKYPRFRRVTDWKASAGVISCGAIMRKITGAAGAKNINLELAMVIRTVERIEIVQFDSSRLDGSTNIGEHSKDVKEASSSVLKWFGNSSAPAGASSPSAGASNQANSPAPAAISSSIAGKQGGAGSDITEKQALAALRRQTEHCIAQMNAIDERIISVQRAAGDTLKTLQSTKAQEDAKVDGREFARRNKSRLEQSIGSNVGAAGGVAAPSAVSNDQSLSVLMGFADSIGPTLKEATAMTCDAVLGHALPAVCDQAIAQLDLGTLDTAIPKLSATSSMQAFSQAVDKIHQQQNKLVKQEISIAQNRTNTSVAAAEKLVGASVKNFKQYINKLKSEVNALDKDIQTVKASGAGTSAAGGNVEAKQEEILKKALEMCKRNNFGDAMLAIVEAANIPLLIRFLETRIVSDNRAEITRPEFLPFPVFVSLCHQLSHELHAQLGAVPLRMEWLHDMVVEWDDHLQSMKEGGKDAQMMAACRGEFSMILNELQTIAKDEVDRPTKRYLLVTKKVFNSLVN